MRAIALQGVKGEALHQGRSTSRINAKLHCVGNSRQAYSFISSSVRLLLLVVAERMPCYESGAVIRKATRLSLPQRRVGVKAGRLSRGGTGGQATPPSNSPLSVSVAASPPFLPCASPASPGAHFDRLRDCLVARDCAFALCPRHAGWRTRAKTPVRCALKARAKTKTKANAIDHAPTNSPSPGNRERLRRGAVDRCCPIQRLLFAWRPGSPSFCFAGRGV